MVDFISAVKSGILGQAKGQPMQKPAAGPSDFQANLMNVSKQSFSEGKALESGAIDHAVNGTAVGPLIHATTQLELSFQVMSELRNKLVGIAKDFEKMPL